MSPTARETGAVEESVVDRIQTWAEGLDEMCGGGFPENGCYLVTGEPGTGKTVSVLSFVARNADLGRPGVLVTAEETPDQMREDAAALGIPVEELEEKDLLRVVDATAPHIEIPSRERYCLDSLGGVDDLLDTLVAAQEEIDAACLGLDSLPALLDAYGAAEPERDLARLSFGLQTMGFTSLLADAPAGAKRVTQGTVRLHRLRTNGTPARGLEVQKLRATAHDREIRPFEIADDGVSVSTDDAFSEEGGS